ncbi:hypothetical protein [Nevskia ramosa]|uniref:hypothetical protein n=1 Tax=Nevskia ramosa TaxID=64002 RepID=UPI0003B52406|nr:hypothetical protein [Nevskia ramosa]
MKNLVGLIITLSLSACAAAGNKFDASKINTLIPGVTTLDSATQELGRSAATETNEDGSKLVKWKYATASLVGTHFDGVAILFGPDGKMMRITKQESH